MLKPKRYVYGQWSILQGTELIQKFPMFGLSYAGKTTLLYRLVLSEFVRTIGDHSFRMETFTVPNLYRRDDNGKGRGVQQKELKFTLWDVAGQTWIIPLWYHYVDNIKAKGVIFVIDSTCRPSLGDAKRALWRLFDHYDALAAKDEEEGKEIEKEGLVLLVFANKQDRINAMTVMEVMQGLDLEGLCSGDPQGAEGRRRQESRWHIRGTVATTGEGLIEGLLWLDWQVNGPPRSSC